MHSLALSAEFKGDAHICAPFLSAPLSRHMAGNHIQKCADGAMIVLVHGGYMKNIPPWSGGH